MGIETREGKSTGWLGGLGRLYSFRGRAGRSEYWIVTVASKLLAIGVAIQSMPMQVGRGYTAFSMSPGDNWVVGIVTLLVWLVPWSAVVVRRLHDIGRSGAWAAGFLVLAVMVAAASQATGSAGGVATVVGAQVIAVIALITLGIVRGTTDSESAEGTARAHNGLALLSVIAIIAGGVLRLGPVEATYQRLTRPSMATQFILEMDDKSLARAWLEGVAGSFVRELRSAGVSAVATVESEAAIRLRAQSGRAIDRDVISRLIGKEERWPGIRALELETSADATVITASKAGLAALTRRALDASVWPMEVRLSEIGVWAATIRREGEKRLIVIVPGAVDRELLKRLITKKGLLTFHFVEQELSEEFIQSSRVQPSQKVLRLRESKKPYLVRSVPFVTGERVAHAETSRDERANVPIVSFRFDIFGARAFGQATREWVGKDIGIAVDDELINVARVREAILGGSVQINVSDESEAIVLAALLRSRALPGSFRVIGERAVDGK